MSLVKITKVPRRPLPRLSQAELASIRELVLATQARWDAQRAESASTDQRCFALDLLP